MKPYEKYKASGVDGGDHRWIGEIPEHWQFIKLKQLVSCNDETLTIRETDDFFINYIEIGDVNLEKGVDNYSNVHIQEAPSRARRIVRANDIIISTVRTYLKAIAKVPEEYNGFIASTGFAVLRAKAIDYNYLNFVVQNEDFINEVISLSVGASYPAISSNNLVNIKAPFPPLQEQTAIAKYLDHQTAIIDELIEKKTKQIALLKEKRQAIINETVTKGLDPTAKMKDSGIEWLGEIPESWEVKKIKFISSVISKGTTPSTEGKGLVDNGIKYLKAENIKDSEVSPSHEFFIDEETHEILKRSQLQENDILFVIAGATIGKVAILPKELTPANTNQAVSFIRLKEGENHKFIHYWLLSSKIYDQIWFKAVQSAQPNLSMESLGNFSVPYPTLHEQELIVNFLNSKIEEFESLIAKNIDQMEKLKEYRQSLISEAVTGKIDVRGWGALIQEEA